MKLNSNQAVVVKNLDKLLWDLAKCQINISKSLLDSTDAISFGDEGFFQSLFIENKRRKVKSNFDEALSWSKRCVEKYEALMVEVKQEFPDEVYFCKKFSADFSDLNSDSRVSSKNSDWVDNMFAARDGVERILDELDSVINFNLERIKVGVSVSRNDPIQLPPKYEV